MKEEINKWILAHPYDYRMISGDAPMTELEYKYILLELEEQGFEDLIGMLNEHKS